MVMALSSARSAPPTLASVNHQFDRPTPGSEQRGLGEQTDPSAPPETGWPPPALMERFRSGASWPGALAGATS